MILNEKWPNERNVKESNSFDVDFISRKSQEMHLKAGKHEKFQFTSPVPVFCDF